MLAPGAAEPSEPERHDQTPTKQRAAGRHSCRLPYLYLGVKATPPNREDGGVHRVPSKSAGKAGALSLGATREMLQRAWPPPLLSPLARGSCPSPTLTGPWRSGAVDVLNGTMFHRWRGTVPPKRGMFQPNWGNVPQKGRNIPPNGWNIFQAGGNIPPKSWNVPPNRWNIFPDGWNIPQTGGNIPPRGRNVLPDG